MSKMTPNNYNKNPMKTAVLVAATNSVSTWANVKINAQ